MKLEDLLVRRAEEQMERREVWKDEREPANRRGRLPSCVCMECRVCKRRLWAREHEAKRRAKR